MLLSRAAAAALVLLLVGLLAFCSKDPPARMYGPSGVEGYCVLGAGPMGRDGKVPDRRPWGGARIDVRDASGRRAASETVDSAGRFYINLNPGEYTLTLHDPKHLSGKTHTPIALKVESGKFIELLVDYDTLGVRDWTPARTITQGSRGLD